MHVVIHFNIMNETDARWGCVEILQAKFLEIYLTILSCYQPSLFEDFVHDGFLKWENQLIKQSHRGQSTHFVVIHFNVMKRMLVKCVKIQQAIFLKMYPNIVSLH